MELFWWGIAGGFAAEVLHWWRLFRNANAGASSNFPVYAKSPVYWILTVILTGLGGLLVYAYASSGTELNAILALNLGASAPLILQSFATQAPKVSRDAVRGATNPTIGNFLSGV